MSSTLITKTVLVFFDDILVYSESWSNHLIHLQLVFDVLSQHELFVKGSKCECGAEQVDYLGHTISRGVVSMDDKKLAYIKEWPLPKSPKELRGFLGLTGYYRRFIKGYGFIAKPLTELLKHDGFIWSQAAQKAFQTLKFVMLTVPVLALPNFSLKFTIEVDASNKGIGTVLSQRGRLMVYFSKGLSSKHQLLSVYEKEMMAILVAIKKLSAYVIRRHFKI